MGLDQYAYVATKSLAEGRVDTEQRDLAYWRKHGGLQDWMEELWTEKGKPGKKVNDFNDIEFELTWEDIDELEQAILNKSLSEDSQWFGSVNPDRFLEKDLEFVKAARTELFMGLRVFYYPSW